MTHTKMTFVVIKCFFFDENFVLLFDLVINSDFINVKPINFCLPLLCGCPDILWMSFSTSWNLLWCARNLEMNIYITFEINSVNRYNHILINFEVKVINLSIANRRKTFSSITLILQAPNCPMLVQSQQWNHQNNIRNLFKVTIKTQEWCQWRRFGVNIVKFEQMSYIFVLFPLLTLSKSVILGLIVCFIYHLFSCSLSKWDHGQVETLENRSGCTYK